jgi:hypothetical protein
MINKSKLDYCEHRCSVNAKLLTLSQKLAALNKEFMQLNDEICMANEAVVVFNVETIQQNTQWIESGIDASEATAESNDILTSENESRVVACNAASRGFEQVPPPPRICFEPKLCVSDENCCRLRVNCLQKQLPPASYSSFRLPTSPPDARASTRTTTIFRGIKRPSAL